MKRSYYLSRNARLRRAVMASRAVLESLETRRLLAAPQVVAPPLANAFTGRLTATSILSSRRRWSSN